MDERRSSIADNAATPFSLAGSMHGFGIRFSSFSFRRIGCRVLGLNLMITICELASVEERRRSIADRAATSFSLVGSMHGDSPTHSRALPDVGFRFQISEFGVRDSGFWSPLRAEGARFGV